MAPWADQPFALIPVKSQKSKAPETEFIAQDMAAAHNNLLRALNSVYNQAPYVEKDEDKRDLLTYTSFWVDWIERKPSSDSCQRSIAHAAVRARRRRTVADVFPRQTITTARKNSSFPP